MKELNTSFDKFLNEDKEQLITEGKFEVTYSVTSRVTYEGEMWKEYADNSGDSEQGYAQMVASDIGLVKGNMKWTGKDFSVIGTNKDGESIVINQTGEYNMYGGPYSPKMGKISATKGGKNMIAVIKKAFKSYGWDGDPDVSRTDIYGAAFTK